MRPTSILWLGLLVACLASGCILLPVPTRGHTGAYKPIDREVLDFIRIGQTSREDVFLHLGAPDYERSGELIYYVEKYDWGRALFIAIPYLGAGGEVVLRKNLWALTIKLDADALVTDCYFDHRTTSSKSVATGEVTVQVVTDAIRRDEGGDVPCNEASPAAAK